MSYQKTFLYILYLFLIGLPLSGQTVIKIGVNTGMTLSHISSVIITNDGQEEADRVGKGQLSYHAGIFASLPITDLWTAEAEAGYERLHFESFNPLFGESVISHLRFGIISNYKLTDWFGVLGGLEVVNRSSKVNANTSALRLNGSATDGIYWQGVAGIRFFYSNLISMDVRATLPSISSVTRTYDGLPADNRLIVERLRAYKVCVSIPLF